jgi:hypothetical protein
MSYAFEALPPRPAASNADPTDGVSLHVPLVHLCHETDNRGFSLLSPLPIKNGTEHALLCVKQASIVPVYISILEVA